MHISRKRFYIITLLFILLPFSTHWRLLLLGTKTNGTVIKHIKNSTPGNTYVKASVIQFQVEGMFYQIISTENTEYPIGETKVLFYDKNDPKRNLLFTFSNLCFSNKMIVPGLAFIFWITFYLSVIHKSPTNKTKIN